jgi:hypothetical protein
MLTIKPSHAAFVKPSFLFYGVSEYTQTNATSADVCDHNNNLTAAEKSFLDQQAG